MDTVNNMKNNFVAMLNARCVYSEQKPVLYSLWDCDLLWLLVKSNKMQILYQIQSEAAACKQQNVEWRLEAW